MAKFSVDVKGAQDPIVLALDVGSTGSRGCLYDGTGRSISKRRDKIEHTFTTHIDGKSTIDPDQVVDEITRLIDYLLQDDVAHRIRAVSLDTFAASLPGVDEHGDAVTPALTYADSRSGEHVDQLREDLDEDEVTERTGARLHTSHLPAMLHWAHKDRPETSAKVKKWMSLGEYIWLRLLGHTAVSTSGAMRVIVPGVPEKIPAGLWCYRIDDERSIVGGALNDVGRMVTWMENVFQLPDLDRRHELLMADPDAATPLVLPFLTGERATGWASDARAVLRDVAYAEGIPIEPIDIKRSTLHDTALFALAVIAPSTPETEVPLRDIHEPHDSRSGYYQERMRRFEELYDATITHRIGGEPSAPEVST